MKKRLIGLLILVLVSLAGFVVADGDRGMGGMMSGSYGSGMMFFGWIFGLLVLAVLVLLVVWLVKQIQKSDGKGKR